MTEEYVVIDTHVHIYPNFSIEKLLESAWNNLHQIASDSIKAIVLTERAQENFFKKLQVLHPSCGGLCVAVSLSSSKTLYVISGTQIKTKENLEVLGIGMEKVVPDGTSTEESIQMVLKADAIPVIPWSPGKWMFARKQAVLDSLKKFPEDEIFLGDIYGHPKIGPTSPVFSYARKRGIGIIAGTDPLPLSNEENIAGRYATILYGDFDEKDPAASIKKMIRHGSQRVGSKATIMEFSRRQLALRLNRMQA